MAFNRYDTISTSTYDPRSLQETLMVPMMRRQQHDEANKQVYTQLGELDKINPLDKHYNEAQRIKAELTSKINSQAEKLATEGFNVNTTSDLFKTNRDVQEMYSPTGKVGQINAAKIAYDKDSAEYLKNATALGHSPEVVQRNLKLIQDKYNQSPVYDDKGRVISMSIDAMPPKYIDHISRAREFFKDAKMSSSMIDQLASSIESDGKGGSYVLSKGAKQKYGSNLPQLQAAVDFLNNEINNPNSDVGKSLKYGFKTPKEAIEDIRRMSPIYNQSEVERGFTSQISNYNPASETKTKETAVPTGIMDPSSTRTIGEELKSVDFSKIGTKYGHSTTGSSPSVAGSGTGTVQSNGNGTYNYKDILKDPITQSLYEGSYRKLVKAGKIPAGSNINSPENAKKIGFYMNNHLRIPTVANDIIRPDISPNAEMFMGNFAKKSGSERNFSLNQEVQAGFRDVLDPDTGIVYKKKDFEKGGKAEGYKLEYVGYDSPVNARGSKFGNSKEQSVMPHRAILKDADGKVVNGNVSVSRTKQEIESPEFKKAYEINKTYIGALSNLGEWVIPKGVYSGSKRLKEFRVRYNEDGTISMKKGTNGQPENMSLADYQNNMDAIMSDQSK